MSMLSNKVKEKSTGIYNLTLRYHVIFWAIYFLFNAFRWGSYFNDYGYSLKTNIIGFPIHMILCYLNIYLLMPVFLYKKRYFTYVIMLVSSLFIMVFVKFNLTYFLVSHNVWPEGPEVINKITLNYTIDMMIGELYVIAFVTAIKTTFDWIVEHKRVADLERLQLETELMFLRMQVSPHFFFNTLNNIYSLAIEKSEKTPKLILKLSELMHYLLYETKKKRQNLEKEILCIQNYLDLERIRHGENLEINMDITGDIHNKKIAPMILLSFIENAFKHGAKKNIGKIKIDISFDVKDKYLYFKIENPSPAITNFKQQFEKNGGIGLKNVRKRLSLGYAADEYDLKIQNENKKFIVNLKIKVK